jgi:ribosomal protein S21
VLEKRTSQAIAAGEAAIEDFLKPIEDSDMDSMFMLPLSIMPIQTTILQSARMIKNHQLQSVVEIFRDDLTGSGQLDIEDLPQKFGWPEGTVHPDHALLRKLALLPSFDVYSLRKALRDQGIAINDVSALRLSDEKQAELGRYMVAFTRPLVKVLFSGEDVEIDKFEDVLRLFKDPDVKKVRERLFNMAKTLNVEVQEVPKFLEDYGDTFLSLSYFRHCLDRLTPYFDACIKSLGMIRSSYQLKQNHHLMRTCDVVEQALQSLRGGLAKRLSLIEARTRKLFENMTQEEFRSVRTLIEQQHVAIGAILCGLTVKMNIFARLFPHDNAGGPVKRADFIQNEMMKGIDSMRELERRMAS